MLLKYHILLSVLASVLFIKYALGQGVVACRDDKPLQEVTVEGRETALRLTMSSSTPAYVLYHKNENGASNFAERMMCLKKCTIHDLQPNTTYCICVRTDQNGSWANCGAHKTKDINLKLLEVENVYFQRTARNYFVHWTYNSQFEVHPILQCKSHKTENFEEQSCVEYQEIKPFSDICNHFLEIEGNSAKLSKFGDSYHDWFSVCIQISNHQSKTCTCVKLGEKVPTGSINIYMNGTNLVVHCEGIICLKDLKLEVWSDDRSFCLLDNQFPSTSASSSEEYDLNSDKQSFDYVKNMSQYSGKILTANVYYTTKLNDTEIVHRLSPTYVPLQNATPEYKVHIKAHSIEVTWYRNTLIWQPTLITASINGNVVSKEIWLGCEVFWNITDLDPFTNYSLSLDISANNQTLKTVTHIFQTKPQICTGTSHIHYNFKLNELTWKRPDNNHEKVECYRISFQFLDWKNENERDYEKECNCNDANSCSKLISKNVLPDSAYRVSVSCINEQTNEYGEPTVVQIQTPAIPPNLENVALEPLLEKSTHNRNNLGIRIQNFQLAQKGGKINNLTVYYRKKGAKDTSENEDFLALHINTTDRKFSLTNLSPGSLYQVKIGLGNNAGLSNSTIHYFKTSERFIQVGVLFAVVVVLMTILLYFVFLVSPKYISRIHILPDIDMVKIIAGTPMKTYPIGKDNLLENLRACVQKKSILFQQFSSLRALDPVFLTSDANDSNLNDMKNRYRNIVPYNYSRVVLKEIPGEIFSDYINASYLDSYHQELQFIATQGPMKHTIGDFWRMIWQKNVFVIIMLGDFIEDGRDKCYRYCPLPADTSGTLLVKERLHVLIESHNEEHGWIQQTVILTKGTRQRKITHIQYIAWPDMGCPAESNQVLDFMEHVKKCVHETGPQNHIVIHCSAGVGRTGCFVELYNLFDEINDDSTDSLDIFFDIVLMRHLRMKMVQTTEQYAMIHKLILLYYAKKLSENDKINEADYENVFKLVTDERKTLSALKNLQSEDDNPDLQPFTEEELESEDESQYTQDKDAKKE